MREALGQMERKREGESGIERERERHRERGGGWWWWRDMEREERESERGISCERYELVWVGFVLLLGCLMQGIESSSRSGALCSIPFYQ